MAKPILIHVLEEIGQDGHCETLDRLRSRNATVLPRDARHHVFEVYPGTGDTTALQADLTSLQAHGNMEVIAEQDYVRRFARSPSDRPPNRRLSGGPYIL